MRTSPALAVIVLAAGCRGSREAHITPASLKAGGSAESGEMLKMSGLTMPVIVKRSTSGENISLSINLNHGEEVEQEQYRLRDNEFDLVRADIDIFAPPIPLLMFPLSATNAWDWKGTAQEGATMRNATARIQSSPDEVAVGSAKAPAEKVVVHLSIDSGSPVPAQRDLSFWFTEKDGLLKREFGQGSTRLPADQP